MIAKQLPLKFAFAIEAEDKDWSWIPNAPNMTVSYSVGSQLMIGDYNPSAWNNAENPYPMEATTDSGSGNWTFALEQFAFGFTEEVSSVNTSSYVNMTSTGYDNAWVTLGHPGIGLPQPVFETFTQELQAVTNNLWNCEDRFGYFCYAPVTCETFIGEENSSYNLTKYDFRIVFETQTDRYLRVPLLSLMRNAQTVDSQCNLLVYYLEPKYDMGNNIVLGSAFLQSYFAQFEYHPETNLNKMTLTLAKKTIPGTYLGSQTTVPSNDPIPEPTPVTPDTPTPAVTPLPTSSNATSDDTSSVKMTTNQIIFISLESLLTVILIVAIIWVCVMKGVCKKQEYNNFNPDDFEKGINKDSVISGQPVYQPVYDPTPNRPSVQERNQSIDGVPLLKKKNVSDTLDASYY